MEIIRREKNFKKTWKWVVWKEILQKLERIWQFEWSRKYFTKGSMLQGIDEYNNRLNCINNTNNRRKFDERERCTFGLCQARVTKFYACNFSSSNFLPCYFHWLNPTVKSYIIIWGKLCTWNNFQCDPILEFKWRVE